MVRDFVTRHRRRGPRAVPRPDRPAARRGVRLRRRRLQRDRHLPRVPPRRVGAARTASRPAATASRPAGTPPTITGGAVGRAARRALLPAAGRGRPDHRVALDLGRPGLPGRRPGARLAARHRPRRATSRSPTPRRWTRSRCCAAPRASSRRSRARTRWPAPQSARRASSGRTRRSSSTCPAAATRTSTPPALVRHLVDP